MPNYRRRDVPGGTFFFTLVAHGRQRWLCSDATRAALRASIADETGSLVTCETFGPACGLPGGPAWLPGFATRYGVALSDGHGRPGGVLALLAFGLPGQIGKGRKSIRGDVPRASPCARLPWRSAEDRVSPFPTIGA